MYSKNNLKKFIAFALTLVTALSWNFTFATASYADSTSEVTSAETVQTVTYNGITNAGITEAAAKGIFWVEKKPDGNLKFVNCAHGYAITIPTTMQPVDMSHCSLVSVLEDKHRHLEIYKSTIDVPAGFFNYGYKFLENTTDHSLTNQFTTTIAGKTAYIKEWQRNKLARMEKDNNYYASVTLVSGTTVYDFFFSSDVPFSECGGYIDIPSSLYFFTPRIQGLDIKGNHVAKPNWNAETAKFYQQCFSSSSALLWGTFNPAYEYDMSDLSHKEEKIGYKFPILLHYTEIHPNDDPYLIRKKALLERTHSEGRTLELSLQPPLSYSGRNMMYGILNGDYDKFLNDYAKMISDFGHPILFRPFNEMNGDWCSYSAYHTSRDTEIYKSVYRYIYSVFEAQGANRNTIWVWNPNGKSYPDYHWNDQRRYYPGDEYVDVVGLTKYNTGSYYKNETWQSFNTCFYDVYAKASALYNQPFMITEFASASYGGNKVSWVKNMFYYIKGYNRIKVAVWWDGADFDSDGNIARSYYISDPIEVMDVFANYLGKPQENGNNTDKGTSKSK